MNKDITVIIPMYNSEKTIVKCLDSVKNQTNLKLIKEIIIINDGSTDDSEKIVKKYISNNNIPIKLFNQSNKGVSASRNIGMDQVETKWIALLDSDDEWLPNKIENQMEILLGNDEIDFLGGAHTDNELRILNKKINYLYKANLKDLCMKSFPQTSTVIFKTKIYNSIGGYDVKQSYAEDLKFFMNICINYNYYYSPEKVVYYGDGKRGFGDSGLSANLKEMHKGNRKNIEELYKNKNISLLFYMILKLVYKLKYLRRIVIVRKNNSERNK